MQSSYHAANAAAADVRGKDVPHLILNERSVMPSRVLVAPAAASAAPAALRHVVATVNGVKMERGRGRPATFCAANNTSPQRDFFSGAAHHESSTCHGRAAVGVFKPFFVAVSKTMLFNEMKKEEEE